MVYAEPGQTFTAVAEDFDTGLAGTITVQIERGDGTTYTAATTAGIVEIEAGAGVYAKANLTAPSTRGTYILYWTDGSGTTASEELIVTSDAPVAVTPTGTGDFTFGKMRTAMDDLAGLDLDDEQRDDLLNQAHRELAVRSEWYRATIELGPGVTEQREYTLPDDVYRILKVTINGEVYKPLTEEAADRLTLGLDSLLVAGICWMTWGSANERQVGIYPTVSDGTAISARVVERPALMTDDADVPVVPEEFTQAIIDKATGIALGSVEDNPDLRSYYEDQFDRKVGELRRLAFTGARDVGFWGRA
jgi:hypothetical protein